jgi:prohibitin 2
MKNFMRLVGALSIALLHGCGCEVVDPGNRGVVIEWGKVQEPARGEGFQTYCPIGCTLKQVSVRQQKIDVAAPCFSSDLQQVNLNVTVMYRIPEKSVPAIFRDFHGEPFDVLVSPRVQESIKEATATRSAEMIVKERETVKNLALAAVRKKVGPILVIEDMIISDVKLSKQLTDSIESKMVQEQEAAKAKYMQQQKQIEADTRVLEATAEAKATLARAQAEAESIKIRGEALQENPGVIQLQLIEKWNGISPTIVGNGISGINLILPTDK